jgi:hypothetical protein
MNPPRTHARRWVLPAWCTVLTAVMMAPLARPGFLVNYDMVTGPDQRLVPDALGLGSGPPRAVPQDAVLAVVTSLVPGGVVYRVALLGLIFGAAFGAGRLVTRAGTPAQLVAASAYAWNAYVAERLAIGHWTVLVAYAVLPWLLRAALAARRGEPGALARMLLLVALASLTPTGGLLAAPLAIALVRGRARLGALAGSAALQVPWLLPALLSPVAMVSDPAGAEAFAARADSPLGLAGSLLTLGGIWNADVVPDSRALVSATVLTLAWVTLAVLGVRRLPATVGRAGSLVLAGLAVAGMLLALSGTFGGLLGWMIEHVPGAGLLRDGQKFLAWYALALAPAAALGAARLGELVVDRTARLVPAAAVTTAMALVPVMALPDLAWGVWGRLSPVEYPVSWAHARDVLRQSDASGALVVLPYQPFRAFPWNDNRTALDPLPRFVGVETVRPDALTVAGRRLSGEDPRAAAVEQALASTDPVPGLLASGVGWIAVQHDTPGTVSTDLVDRLTPVLVTGVLDLYRVPGKPAEWTQRPPVVPVIAADVGVALLVLALGVRVVVRIGRDERREPGTVRAT